MVTILLAISSLFFPPPHILEIQINDLQPRQGNIRVGLYRSAKAWANDDKPDYFVVVEAGNAASQTIRVENLPEGTYLAAIYQDVNRNGRLDRALIGVPTEAYAFSNNVFPRFRRPHFEEGAFTLTEPLKTIALDLRKW